MIPTTLRYSPLLQVSENGAVKMRHESRDLQGALPWRRSDGPSSPHNARSQGKARQCILYGSCGNTPPHLSHAITGQSDAVGAYFQVPRGAEKRNKGCGEEK